MGGALRAARQSVTSVAVGSSLTDGAVLEARQELAEEEVRRRDVGRREEGGTGRRKRC